jgi:hypothetical protein
MTDSELEQKYTKGAEALVVSGGKDELIVLREGASQSM